MLDRTYNVNRHSTRIKVEADNRVSITKSKEGAKIVRVEAKSEQAQAFLSDAPYLLSDVKRTFSRPHQYKDNYGFEWHQEITDWLTHGVTVLQVMTNKEYIYVEYIDRECEPKKYRRYIEHYLVEPKWEEGDDKI